MDKTIYQNIKISTIHTACYINNVKKQIIKLYVLES